jgi:hypothetical protein
VPNTNYAIILVAPEEAPDGRGRLLHAFATARDLAAAGANVEFYFDGIGVECLTAFHARDNPFSEHYAKLFDQVKPFSKACGVCSRHYQADTAAEALGIEMVSLDEHRSVAQFILDGYVVITVFDGGLNGERRVPADVPGQCSLTLVAWLHGTPTCLRTCCRRRRQGMSATVQRRGP